MNAFSELEIKYVDTPIEERKPFIDKPGSELATTREVDEEEEEDNSDTSIYSLKSSVKIESTTYRGFVTFLKGLIGTGILALPFVINKVGLIPAWILLFVIGYLNLYTMQLVHTVASDLKIPKIDFGRLSERVTGRKWFRYLAEINVHVMQIGSSIPGVVFFYQYFDRVSCIYGWKTFCGVKQTQILLILCFLLPIGAITDLHYLAIPSGIALVFQMLFYLTFLVISIDKISIDGVMAESFTTYNLAYFAIAFATILYAYEAIGMLLEIRSSVADDNKFGKVLYYSFIASTVTYLIFGTVGKLAYGDATQSVIFLNLNQNDKLLVFLEFGYLFGLLITIPAGLFPPTRIIESWQVFRDFIVDEVTGKKSKWKRQLIRQPLIILIVLIASAVPSFEMVVSLIGGLNFTILSFVIPVILYNIHFRNDETKRVRRICNWLILLSGVVLGSIATVESIQELSNTGNAP